ncbi:hypothetical protein GCM10022407_41870 [Hymenobacter antarcticus]|uniref:Uncharacterized protein n=2 Tax=Hymenobacter antarcticus TaxID=486270 RepID=A0ABP7R6W8_9BACT
MFRPRPAYFPMTPYEQLLHLAFTAPNDVKYYLTPVALRAYDELQAAPPAQRPFCFEQVRLGLAMSLLKLVSELGDHDESRQVLDVLHRALSEARSPEDIDRIIGREARLFDRLYENLYVNEQGEELLNLFSRTLDADAPELLEEIALEGVDLARTLDFSTDEED